MRRSTEAVAAATAAGLAAVTVACEPTGPRWMQVQRLCAERGLALVCVQPLVSHIAREQEDYTTHKRDESDAVLIARLAAELHCYMPEELDEAWAHLRDLGRRREPAGHGGDRVGAAGPGSSCRWRGRRRSTAAAAPFESVTWLACLQVVTEPVRRGPGAAGRAGRGGVPGAGRRSRARAWGGVAGCKRIARKVLAVLDDPDVVAWSRRGLLRRSPTSWATWPAPAPSCAPWRRT